MYVCRGGKEPCRTPLFAKDTVCDEQPGAALIRVNGLVDFRPGAVLVKGALCSIICGACRAPVGVVDEQENGIFFFTTAVIDSCYVPTVMMNPVDADVAAVTGETFSEERVPVWSTWVPRPFDMDITDQMPQVEADPQLLPQVEADPQLQKQTQPQNQQPQKQQPKKPQTQKPPLPPRKAPRKEAAQLPRNAALVEGPLEMELDASLIPWDRVLDCVKLIPALVTLLKVFDKADIQRDCRSMHWADFAKRYNITNEFTRFLFAAVNKGIMDPFQVLINKYPDREQEIKQMSVKFEGSYLSFTQHHPKFIA